MLTSPIPRGFRLGRGSARLSASFALSAQIGAANVLHTLSPDHILEMLTNLRQYMTKGARLLLVDLFADPSHADPPMAALMAGEFLVMTGEGDVYSEQEIREWLWLTGWTALERKPLTAPSGLIVAEAASN